MGTDVPLAGPRALVQSAAEGGEALALGGLEQPPVERREPKLPFRAGRAQAFASTEGGSELHGIHAPEPVLEGQSAGTLRVDADGEYAPVDAVCRRS